MHYAVVGEYAPYPYYLEDLGVYIHTIEELCYVIKENLTGLEESFMQPGLCHYIERGLGLGELGSELTKLVRNKESLAAFVKLIFETTGYVSHEELKNIEAILRDNSAMDSGERKKNCGDYFFDNGKYLDAIREYRLALDMVNENFKGELKAAIYHNLACVYARIFDYKQAAALFLRAWQISGNEETYLQYLAALRFGNDRENYVQIVEELKLDTQEAEKLERFLKDFGKDAGGIDDANMIKRAGQERKNGNEVAFLRDTKSVLQKWKREYRRSMEID